MDCEGKFRRLIIHGLGVELHCPLPELEPTIAHQFSSFAENDWPPHLAGITGFIGPYDSRDVLRHVSTAAISLGEIGSGRQAYQDGERIWIIDDRCGLSEINFIRGQWRSWVLSPALTDPHRCMDSAILWPLAQLLRVKGLHLLPAAAVARDGFAAMILCPFGIAGELSALARDGYRIIGQRWCAVRQEEGKVSLLHMPGAVEQTVWPRRAGAGGAQDWIDLHAAFFDSQQNHAFCDAVIVVSSGRRPQASANGLSRWEAGDVIRRAWPIAELHPRKRAGGLASELGRLCRCAEARLSPRSQDILQILQAIRDDKIGHGSGRATLFIPPQRSAIAV